MMMMAMSTLLRSVTEEFLVATLAADELASRRPEHDALLVCCFKTSAWLRLHIEEE